MVWLESLLDSLSTDGICYSDQALSDDQRKAWLAVLEAHYSEHRFKSADIGRKTTLQNDSSIRNDEISWLEVDSPKDMEILQQLNTWRRFLNESLLLSTNGLEAHFSSYKKGHFYKRHLDQHSSSHSRVLTFIIYLHAQWQPADAGELVILKGNTDEVKQVISPLPGRVVIFKSDEIWHEVRKSNFKRFSLTGWFRYDADAFTALASKF